MSDEIKLKSLEEIAAEKAADCLPKGIRLMIIGQKPIFVSRIAGQWRPVNPKLQLELENKHIIK